MAVHALLATSTLVCAHVQSRHVAVRQPSVRAVARSGQPRLFDLSEAAPYLGVTLGVSTVAGALFYLTSDDRSDDEYDRTRASKIAVQSVPTPERASVTTPEGAALMDMLTLNSFPAAWSAAVATRGERVSAEAASDASASSLQSRIAAVQAIARHRSALADLLTAYVEKCFSDAGLDLLTSVNQISPGQSLPPNACSLVRVSQQFPGQSARQVRAYVLESAPSNDPNIGGRFDRLQAARLYKGCIQFGYFIAQVRRTSDAALLNPPARR